MPLDLSTNRSCPYWSLFGCWYRTGLSLFRSHLVCLVLDPFDLFVHDASDRCLLAWCPYPFICLISCTDPATFILSAYPLALRPGEHLRSINWVLSLFFFLLLCRRHLQYAQSYGQRQGSLAGRFVLYFRMASSVHWSLYLLGQRRTNLSKRLILVHWSIKPRWFFLAACLPLSLSCSPRQRWFFTILSAGIIQTQSRAAIFWIDDILCWGFLQVGHRNGFEWPSCSWSVFRYICGGNATICCRTSWHHTFTAQRSKIWQDSGMHSLSPYLGVGMGDLDAFSIVKSLPLYQQTSHINITGDLTLIRSRSWKCIILAFLLLYWTVSSSPHDQWPQRSLWLSSVFCGLLVFIPASLVDFPFELVSCLIVIFLASPFVPIHLPKNAVSFSVWWSSLYWVGVYHQHGQSSQSICLARISSATTGLFCSTACSLHTYAMQRYIETAPEDELELVTILRPMHRPMLFLGYCMHVPIINTGLHKGLSRLARVLKLNLGRKITPFVSEALTCSPNLTEAILILPQNSTVLTTAAVLLDKQKVMNSAFYLMKKAADIDHLGLERYARF